MPYLSIFGLTFVKELLSHLKQPQIFQNARFRIKLEFLNLGPTLLSGCNFKKLLSYLKSALSYLSKCKVSFKTKILEIFDQKYFIWVLRQDFEETVVIFEISTLGFVKVKKIQSKPKKDLSLGSK